MQKNGTIRSHSCLLQLLHGLGFPTHPHEPIVFGWDWGPWNFSGWWEVCLHHRGKDALSHEPFHSCLLPLGAGQQHLKPNELSPTVPQLSKLCRRSGCPVRFLLTQTVFRCPWLIVKLSLMQRPTLVLQACLLEEVPGRAAAAGTDGGDFWFKFFADWWFAGGICSWFCFVMALLL